MFEYYEEIACKLTEANPFLLFEKTRDTEVVIARQFCMVYRNKVLHLNIIKSGERYGRDHSTVVHAKRCIKNYIDTKDPRAKVYRKFLQLCREKASHLNSVDEFGDIESSVRTQLNDLSYAQYLNNAQTLFYNLIHAIQKDDDELQVRQLIENAHKKIHELKFLYE